MGENTDFGLPVLETNRLFLLPWRLEYAGEMLLFTSNEKVIHSAGGWKQISDINKAKAKIKSYITRKALNWAIAIKAPEGFKIIGSIGMQESKALKEYPLCMDFGYLLAEEYWGQGICTEAAQKIMEYAFLGLKCDAMTVSHRVYNTQSQRVVEKCKFKLRGIYPKSKQQAPNSQAAYSLSREDYMALYNKSESSNTEYHETDILQVRKNNQPKKTNALKPSKQREHVKGSPYSLLHPIRKIHSINYIKEPTGYLCGQSCVAMLADVSVDEVIAVLGSDKGTSKQDLKKGLDYYGIRYAPKSVKHDANIMLPELCILRMILPGYSHWGIYFKGVYYDPEFGVLNECPPRAKIIQVWEIYS